MNANPLPSEQRLVLGTAQLGVNYGIANASGQPSLQVASNIIREAWAHGIRELDSAQWYGKSERILGCAFSEQGVSRDARVISKFHPSLDHLDFDVLSSSIDETIRVLGVPTLHMMMIHDEDLLALCAAGLSEILETLVSSGKTRRIGASVYSPGKAIDALNTPVIDAVQIPTNILDRRFEKAGVFELAVEKNKSLYVRSVFLQGLLLMPSEKIPPHMAFAKPTIARLESLCERFSVERMELALGYVKAEMPCAKVIIGVDIPSHIETNMDAWQRDLPVELLRSIKDQFQDVGERILNPTLWPAS